MGSTWTSAVLCALAVAVAAVFAVRGVRRRADRAAAGAHALMGAGMAAMFAPAGDPTPPVVGAAVFAAVAAWFAARLLRGRPAGPGGPAHLVIAPAAMAAMYLTGVGHASTMPGDSTMPGMDMGPGGVGAAALGVLWLALAGYFVWHAWRCASLGAPAPVAAGSTVTVDARPVNRVEHGAHVVMSGLMAAMFLLAI